MGVILLNCSIFSENLFLKTLLNGYFWTVPASKKLNKKCVKMAIWKSQHPHLGISIGIDVGIGIVIVNFCLPFEALLFAFRSFLWNKESMVKSSSNTHASFPGSICCCEEKKKGTASEERNSAMGVISGVLKTRKAESCSLYVCVFLLRNHIRDHFLEIFCKSQNNFKKFG